MRRYTVACLVSALLGMLVAGFVRDAASPAPAGAQHLPPAAARQRPLGSPTDGREPARTQRRAPPTDDGFTPEERVNIAVYENVNRSVVNINTKTVRADTFFFFDVPGEGAGSGSVLDSVGHILTNYHVVEGAREIEVTLFDGQNYPARLVGEDPSSDLAVIRIDAPEKSLFPVELADSTRLKVGQRVFAIGNPFGLERTLTTGIISSLNREIPSRNGRRIKSIIQIDAAINPGNSGGPLLDSHSRLIGMNTAIASKSGQSSGVGFAIPASTIGRIVPQLIENGRVIRPDVGIVRVYQTEEGLLIHSLTPRGPAEQAGLRGPAVVRERKRQGPFTYDTQRVDRSAADLIVAVDGEKVITADEFLTAIESKRPGDEVVITVVRAGAQTEVKVRLGAGEN